MLITDVNEDPIVENAQVEYAGGSEADGLRGRVDDIGSDGWVGVEWDSAPGDVQWHCPTMLRVMA